MRGAVTVAADKFLAPLLGAVGVPDAERRACWAGQRQTLESLVSVTSAGVVDENGFGVVAKQPLRADQIIIDPTVLLVPRPSDYARAHLPPYDYIAFGANDYALLREVALKHCSLDVLPQRRSTRRFKARAERRVVRPPPRPRRRAARLEAAPTSPWARPRRRTRRRSSRTPRCKNGDLGFVARAAGVAVGESRRREG